MMSSGPSDLRSIILPVMADRPGLVFRVAELVRLVDDAGLETAGPISRAVSDSLRMPLKRGWVVRVGRGRYRFGVMPSTSLRRQRRWRQGLRWGYTWAQRREYVHWRPVPDLDPPPRC